METQLKDKFINILYFMQKNTDFAPRSVKVGRCPAYVKPCVEDTVLPTQELICNSISGDFDDIHDDIINF